MKKNIVIVSFLLLNISVVFTSNFIPPYQQHSEVSSSTAIHMPAVSSTEDQNILLTEDVTRRDAETVTIEPSLSLIRHAPVNDQTTNTSFTSLIPEHAQVVEVPVPRRGFSMSKTIGFIYIGTILTLKFVQDAKVVYSYWINHLPDQNFPTFDLLESGACLAGLATLANIYNSKK